MLLKVTSNLSSTLILLVSAEFVLKCDYPSIKATEQCFLVVLFIMLCKLLLTFESVGEILKCDHSN